MKNTITELASGVDALYASARTPIPSHYYSFLESMKERAIENASHMHVEIGGELFALLPYSWQKYPLAFEHRNGRLGFTKSAHVPSIRVQIRSEFIHSVGPRAALAWFSERLHDLEIFPAWSLSRLDLYTDIQGWDISIHDKEKFVCRGKDISYHEISGKLSGFNFGRRSTKTVLCRIYNKSLENESSKKLWHQMAWNDKYDQNEDVIRIEFEFNRAALKQFGLDSVEEALNSISGLWSHVTQEWLTHRSPNSDSNKSRWPISEEWKAVQMSPLAGSRLPLERIHNSIDEVALDSLVPALRGYLTSFAEKLGAVDLNSSMKVVSDFFTRDEQKTGLFFSNLIAEKARRLR